MSKTVEFKKRKSAATVADEFVGTAKKAPDTLVKKVSVELPETLHRRVKATCAMRGQKISDVVRELLAAHFPEEENPNWKNAQN